MLWTNKYCNCCLCFFLIKLISSEAFNIIFLNFKYNFFFNLIKLNQLQINLNHFFFKTKIKITGEREFIYTVYKIKKYLSHDLIYAVSRPNQSSIFYSPVQF